MFYFQAIHEELERAQLDNRRKEEGKEKREKRRDETHSC